MNNPKPSTQEQVQAVQQQMSQSREPQPATGAIKSSLLATAVSSISSLIESAAARQIIANFG